MPGRHPVRQPPRTARGGRDAGEGVDALVEKAGGAGGRADPDMARVVADARVPWILMHWRGHSRDMQALARYGDVVADVRTELTRQAAGLPVVTALPTAAIRLAIMK